MNNNNNNSNRSRSDADDVASNHSYGSSSYEPNTLQKNETNGATTPNRFSFQTSVNSTDEDKEIGTETVAYPSKKNNSAMVKTSDSSRTSPLDENSSGNPPAVPLTKKPVRHVVLPTEVPSSQEGNALRRIENPLNRNDVVLGVPTPNNVSNDSVNGRVLMSPGPLGAREDSNYALSNTSVAAFNKSATFNMPNDSFQPVYPSKSRSVLITNNKKTYRPIAQYEQDDEEKTHNSYLNPEESNTIQNNMSFMKNKSMAIPKAATGTAAILLPDNEEREVEDNDAMRAYEFVIDDAEVPPSPSDSDDEQIAPSSGKNNASQGQRSVSDHAPFGREQSGIETSSSVALQREEAAELVKSLTRSFALQRSFAPKPSDDHSPFGGEQDVLFPQDTGAYTPDGDYFFDLPMPEALSCTSRENLRNDSVSLKAVFQSFYSEAVLKALLFGARVTLFCTFPAYLLVNHPTTKGYFVSGMLLPILGTLCVREPCSVGMQCVMIIGSLQGVAMCLVWGVFMNAIGAKYNTSGWWCAVIAGCFGASLLGDLFAKRILMMFLVIVMQMEHVPGGDTVIFPVKLARDICFSTFFSLCAVVFPYPTFCKNMAKDAMIGIHKLHGAALGNAMKAFWAPVLIDAKIAYHQIPFLRIREVSLKMRRLLMLCRYEPLEFNLNNILRGERLVLLADIKVDLYSMAATSAQRLEDVGHFTNPTSRAEVKKFKEQMQMASGALAKEIIAVFMTIGQYIDPKDIVTKMNFDPMCEKAQVMKDLIDEKRAEMFYLQKLTKDETNYLLGILSFCSALVNIAAKFQKLEERSINFDKSKYPSLLRRIFDFFFYETWRDFWAELPKRLTLATDRDVRLWKDGIKYSCGFAVACAFTLNYDKENIYFFGMAILVRLAQQTASETLFIGTQRLCGVAIGASLSLITVNKTHNVAEKTLLTMTWEFIAMSLAYHPKYGQMAQYVAVIAITGQSLAPNPATLLNRVTDNVFAFISYFLICVLIFPVDPIRVLWNTRTRIFITLNKIVQNCVTVACAPVTKSGVEVQFLLQENNGLVKSTHGLLADYQSWMEKSEDEPTLRGGEYPTRAVSKVLITLSEIMALHEALMQSVTLLHRVRHETTQTLVHDMMELLRPFMMDVGKLYHRYFQELIDSTETPLNWSMESAVRTLWKGHLACRMLRHVTGNIQRNMFAAVQQVSGEDRKKLNQYINSALLEDTLAKGTHPELLKDPANEELFERLLAMSFHMSGNSLLCPEDLHAFNNLVIIFQLELKTMGDLILPMLEIHDFEKSRNK